MNDVTPDNARFFDLKDASGAIVAQVTPGSPADHAGLKTGDVIRQLNGDKNENGSALQVAVSEDQPGTKITLGILRNGQPQSIPITVGEFNGNNPTEAADNSNSNPNGNRTGKLGLAVGNITDDARQQLNVPESVHGAIIETVRPGSPAEDAGLSRGNIILEVNRKPTTSASQFADQVRATPPGRDILLLVWIKGNSTFITVHPSANNPGE
ncbi:MAG: PDZ domain-containing protein [Acidobacteriota bacterium]